MRLSRNASPSECKAFLDSTDYPGEGWTEELLARYCLLTRIELPCGSAAGYIWFSGIDKCPAVLDFHIALDPKIQGRVPASVWADLYLLARSTGARSLLARPLTVDHAALLQRYGFSLHGPFAVLSINPLDPALHPAILRAVARRINQERTWAPPSTPSPTTSSA
jgi:hypothetical protein